MNITLSPELEKLVNEKVQTGEFENAEAVVTQALHALVERDREESQIRKSIRDKIDRGIAQAERGEFIDGEGFFEHLRQKGEDSGRQRP